MLIHCFDFGKTKAGKGVKGITIENDKGMSISVINYGATLQSFQMADKAGKKEECVLGYDNISDYENYGSYFGATIGRVGNRIGKARYTLDGVDYALGKNDRDCNHLHGGVKSFAKVIWDIESLSDKNDRASIKCTYFSKDGEENYPGNLSVEVQYILTESGQLIMDYTAKTDRRTPVNLTNHSYWNLSGDIKEKVYSHKLQIEAESYLPVDEVSIPTGEFRKVENSPFDFRELKELGPALEENGGFDHNFNLSMEKSTETKHRMYVEHRGSGRVMEILTTEPGVQFYTGNFLQMTGEKGFEKHQGLCLETQMFPDSVNKKQFPSIILNPEELYRQTTIHNFSLKD